jgi:ABC-2 type transport system ATP-binding protein
VSIIRAGRTVETGALADLRHLTRTSIEAELAGPPTGIEALPGVHDVLVRGDRVTFDVDTVHLDDALRALTRLGVRTLTSQPPTLEELFLRHYAQDEPTGHAVPATS